MYYDDYLEKLQLRITHQHLEVCSEKDSQIGRRLKYTAKANDSAYSAILLVGALAASTKVQTLGGRRISL